MRLRIEEYIPVLDRFFCRAESNDLHAVELSSRLGYADGNDLVGREFECDALIPITERPYGNVKLLEKE